MVHPAAKGPRHARPPPLRRFGLFFGIALASTLSSTALFADCPFCLSFGPGSGSGPNVRWSASDSISACAAGDTVVLGGHSSLHPHPSRLRVSVEYFSNSCDPRVGVPPDSIWLEYATASGNAKINDKGTRIFADDTTDVCGFARVTVPSLSGCGQLTLYLYVSGVLQGSQVVTVRTTDTDADGRRTSADVTGLCDINYDGLMNSADLFIGIAHDQHWHRNALHGTMVRRTNYCETCQPRTAGTRGGSEVFWSASGRYISHTQFVDAGGNRTACKVFIVPSDPAEGNALTQFTFAPDAYHDYDPSWSPLNTEIVFDRADSVIIRKPVPWSGSTTETVVTSSSSCGQRRGDSYPAVSPDGQWVAFSRCNPPPPLGPGGWSPWKVPITGGTATQLTPTEARTDNYPQWSPDGALVLFQRQDAAIGPQYSVWQIPSGGGSAQQVFTPSASPDIHDAVNLAASADGEVYLVGYGKRDLLVRNVVTHTLDPDIISPTAAHLISNYPDTIFAEKSADPLLSPRISPDGTRLTLGSKQIWAARRNMNLPPAFISVTSPEEGTRSIADTTATMSFTIEQVPISVITVLATDPENDPLTYRASFLQTWMIWNPVTRQLTLDPPISANHKTFYVKFWVTTPSGGTDSFIAIIAVVPATLGGGSVAAAPDHGEAAFFTSRTHESFAVTTPSSPGITARLWIFDLSGRRVASISGPSASTLAWNGKDERTGALAAPGIYFYRVQAGSHRQEGKIAVVR